MDFWDRLAAASDRLSVLRHPFYVRWSEGDLAPAEIALYAGQYAHAVEALAQASRHAAELAPAELAAHAAEEEAHIGLWQDFASAVGCEGDSSPIPETRECVAAWAETGRDLPTTLVALYAIESAQPAISETKLAGLIAHYGHADQPATAYFDVHATRDLDHAAHGRELLAAELGHADHDALLAEAERVLAANWRLLDGVEDENARLGNRRPSPVLRS